MKGRKLMDEKEGFDKAKKRVMEIKGFYVHFLVYLVMSIFFLVINLLSSPGVYWFYWPILGWGIGVFFHAMGTFNKRFLGKDWEDKKIKEILEKDNKSTGK